MESKRRGPYGKRKYEEEKHLNASFNEDTVRENLEMALDGDISEQMLHTNRPVISDEVSLNFYVDERDYPVDCTNFLDTDVLEQEVDTKPTDKPSSSSDHYGDDAGPENFIVEVSTDNYEHMLNTDLMKPTEDIDPITDDMTDELSFHDANETFSYEDDSDIEIDSENYGNDAQTNMNAIDDEEDGDTKPLYPGAGVSLGGFMLLISLFCVKHNLVGDAILQLLNIISLALPAENLLCTSLHSYKSYFRKLRNPLIHHYYCRNCLGYLKDKDSSVCPYKGCEKQLEESDKSYFLEIPIDEQLKHLFSIAGFYDKLKLRFNRVQDGRYRDIYDGKLYQSYLQNEGPLSRPENISFTFNTDGAPVFKSSKVSIWPLFLVINELPYKMRIMKENMILAGLWFGNQKPAMGSFLFPFMETFKKLNEGILCAVPTLGSMMCKAFLLCGTADLPARALLCNSVQFNGASSCWKCLQTGETAARGKGHAHVFPFQADDPKGPARTKEGVIDDSRKAMDNIEKGISKYISNGIKGPSWLSFFPKFDIVNGIAIDYMHGVLLGVQKLLLRLWFSVEFKNEMFSINRHLEEVDNRLQEIHPTIEIGRLPRSIENDLKYWKASEYRSFLLFYGVPVLHGILDTVRLAHFALFVNSVQIFLKCGSTEQEIDAAEAMMSEFCSKFQTLYDEAFLTLNVHQLLHLADSVRYLGPLYTHSCFSFEDKNGFMLKMIRGTQNIDNQVITGVSFVQKLPELKQKCVANDGSQLENLYHSIEYPNILKRGEAVAEGEHILGAIKTRRLSDEEYNRLWEHQGADPIVDKYQSFNRIEIREHLIYGSEYARMIKRDNTTVAYEQNDSTCFGRVHFFLILNNEDKKNSIVAFIDELQCPQFLPNINLLQVFLTNRRKFIRLNDIVENCLFLSIAGRYYVCRFPNKLESD